MDKLRELRGFGPGDPVPVAFLDHFCIQGESLGNVLSEENEQEIFGESRTVCCPILNHGIRPVTDCRSCPHFSGMGEVKITGDADVNRRYRVICSFPKPRTISRGDPSTRIDPDYRAKLAASIRARGGPDQETEAAIFVEQTFTVNCPVSRAKAGAWRVTAPPCPMCEYYRGVTRTNKGPKILCAHRFGVQIGSTVMGQTLLV